MHCPTQPQPFHPLPPPPTHTPDLLQVFTYYGQQVAQQAYETLFEAAWLPAPPGTYQDRPQSPERLAASAAMNAAGPQAAMAAARANAYVPPSRRGAGGAASESSASFSLAFDPSDRPGRVKAAAPGAAVAGLQARQRALPPGAEGLFDKPKPQAKKKGGGGGGGGGAGGGGGGAPGQPPQGGSSGSASASAVAADVAARLSMSGPAPSGAAADGGAGRDDGEARAKRIRALQKKLRQVQQLKEKRAAEGERSLEPEQIAKLATEPAILAELQALEAGGALHSVHDGQ